MKWNWGKGIALSFTVFCGLMIYLVIQSFQTDFFLVSKQYYKDELSYQDRIDDIKRGQNTEVEITQQSEQSIIRFNIQTTTHISGQIHFYRPDNAKLDYKINFSEKEISIAKKDLTQGRYIAKISWLDQNQSYYQEKEIIVQ